VGKKEEEEKEKIYAAIGIRQKMGVFVVKKTKRNLLRRSQTPDVVQKRS